MQQYLSSFSYILIFLAYYFLILVTEAKECPDIKILNPYKSRTWIREGIQIHNSTIRLLRGGSQPGTSQPINNMMVWDMTNNHMLKIFDIDIQISKMLYCKQKRKLLALGTHKILDIHPLNFNIIDEYNIGGVYIQDVEESDSLLLISRDQGNPFLYDIYLRQIVETLPYQYLNINGEGWAAMATLKDYNIFINSKLMLFDRNNNNKFIAFLLGNVNQPASNNRVCAYKSANFLITTNLTTVIQLGTIYSDSQGITQHKTHDFYTEVPVATTDTLRFNDLFCIMKNSEYYVVGSIAKDEDDSDIYKGATVLKIVNSTDPITNTIKYNFVIQEQWKYRRWRQDMEFFLFDEGTHRGHSISEYEHYSYEFLESNEAQCDFDGDGIIDSQCRMAKTICHWTWDLNMGAYFLGPNSETFLHANDNQKGYQVRDWNQTELLRFQYPRLIDKKQLAIRRVLQQSSSTYKLPYDTYILKMCWNYYYYSEMLPDHYNNAGFYIYQNTNIGTDQTDTYNLISYMNPSSNSAKYLNPYDVIASFTYNDELHACVYYTVLEIGINDNGQNVDNAASQSYFSNHNKECYKLRNGNIVSFYQLKMPSPIEYGKGLTQYSKCAPFFAGGYLVCRNLKPMLEFWSLLDYSLTTTVDLSTCLGNYDLAAHRSRIYIGCESSIVIYNHVDQSIQTFVEFTGKLILYIVVVDDILAVVYSTMEINVYDLRPIDGSQILVLQYADPQDCCTINSVDIHPVTKRLMWASIKQVNQIDLTSCLDDPKNCLTCDITAFFKYDPEFSFLKQKYIRNSWPTALPQLYFNPKFLDSGLGTIEQPYQMDMNILQLYFKTHLYKQNIVNFNQVTLNIYIDSTKEQYMSNYLLDWVHDLTHVNFIPWDGSSLPNVSDQKIKIVVNSPKYFNITINNWQSIDMTNIQIVCPLCSSNTLSFTNSGSVYLRNFLSSQNITDLIEPLPNQADTRIFPNIRINVSNVNTFVLDNQKISNTINDDLNKIPFFTFNQCNQVKMTNLIFENIVNQESLFESTGSSIYLESITFTKLNTCIDTTTKRTKFSIIPFQNLIATNITFQDNQFCDMCLFQNMITDSDVSSNLISISNVDIINNKFDKYTNSRVLFFKMSLVSLISTNQAIEIKNVNFKNNVGTISLDSSYYFEIISLKSVLLSSITITDENLVGIGNFNKIQNILMDNITFINTQYLPDSNLSLEQKQLLSYKQNVVLLQDIDTIALTNSKIIGMESNGIVTVQIEESSSVLIQNLQMKFCSFKDSLFASISNLNTEIKNITIVDSDFTDNVLQTQLSHIQVGLFWIRAERSQTKIKVQNTTFINNELTVNQNTQKKSSLSITIENSISDLQMLNCTFHNQYATSVIGDLFLNIQTFLMESTFFQQNLTNFIKSVNFDSLTTDEARMAKLITQFEKTTLKGTFLQVQAQQITINHCIFTNAISAEGAVQMYPNNNYLQVNLRNDTFSNLYASSTGTAILISTLTSPAQIEVTNCHFNNLWLGNQQKQEKAHFYLESSSSNANSLNITNIDVYNIGNLITSTTNSYQSTHFIYQDSFIIYLLNSQIHTPKTQAVTLTNRKLMLQKNSLYKDFKNNTIRLLLNLQLDLQTVMRNQQFYGSCLIGSSKGLLNITNVTIQGTALINDQYKNVLVDLQQSNVIFVDQSTVQISGLYITNLSVNMIGGIVFIQNSIYSTIANFTLQNNQLQKQLLDEFDDLEMYQELSLPIGFINCFKSSCSFQNLTASCDKNSPNECFGRVLNSQQGAFSLDSSEISHFQIQNRNGTALLVQNPSTSLSISNSQFHNLYTNSSGGAIYIYQNNQKIQPKIKIFGNTFSSNEAKQYGGAISFESTFDQSSENTSLTSNTFQQNKAQISGAIYYGPYYFELAQLRTNTFINNTAEMGQDIFSEPSGLHVKLVQDDKEEIFIGNSNYTLVHGSGLQLPKIEANLYYLDNNGNKLNVDVSFLSQQKEILEISMSLDGKTAIKSSDSSSLSDFFISGNVFSSYDSDKKVVYFSNIELYGREGTDIYLLITSSIIKKKQQIDSHGNVSYEPYRFVIPLTFRGCSKFEIITQNTISSLSSSIKKCQTCPDLSYSKNKEVCEQCPVGASCKANEEMIIKPGYWRGSQESYSVFQCPDGFEGCIGGQDVSNQLCLTGYIGPLCKECDLFDLRGDGQFAHFGKTLCKPCQFNFLGVMMILGTIIISIYLTVRAIQSITNYLKAKILVKFMKQIKWKRIREVDQLQSQNILIKILMTYFQLICIIRTIDIKVPNFLPEMSFYFGNPATNVTMNVNCLMPEYLGVVHYIYYSFFMSFSIPFLHLIVLAITLKCQSLMNKEIMSINDLKAGIIFFFTYFQPEFIYSAIQLMTCKTIDTKKYNQANISIECESNTSYMIILSFVIIIFGFLIPLFLYKKLAALIKDQRFQNNSFLLEHCEYAFLCINYKTERYYWEFVRMGERLLFILIASIFNSNQTLKIFLLIFVSQGYCFILKKNKPFKNSQFNNLEIATNHIISFSFLLAIVIFSEDSGDVLDVFFYVIFMLINWIIITYILLLVMQEIVNKITDKMISFIESNVCIRYAFEQFLSCLNCLPFFKLNFDLKLYLSKKKKPLLYQKIRDIFLQLLKLPQEERNMFFLSIKEQKNQSRYISKIMSEFKTQYQNKSSNTHRSPTQNFQNKLDSIIIQTPEQENLQIGFSKLSKKDQVDSPNKQVTSSHHSRKNFFQSFCKDNSALAFDGVKEDKSHCSSQKPSFSSISFDNDQMMIGERETYSNTKFDTTARPQELEKESPLYLFPVDSIKRISQSKKKLQSQPPPQIEPQSTELTQVIPDNQKQFTYTQQPSPSFNNKDSIQFPADSLKRLTGPPPLGSSSSGIQQFSQNLKNQQYKNSLIASELQKNSTQVRYIEDSTNYFQNNENNNSESSEGL